MEIFRKIGIALTAIIAVIAFKLWNKSSSHDDLKERLVEICADNKDCSEAVNIHFDACFDKHYSIGNKRRSGGLNQEKFLGCFNRLSGSEYFSISTKEEG